MALLMKVLELLSLDVQSSFAEYGELEACRLCLDGTEIPSPTEKDLWPYFVLQLSETA